MSSFFLGLDRDTFPLRLRLLRKAKGLTQDQLAEKVGLKRSAVTNLEKGLIKPSVDVFCGLGSALEAPLDYLAGREAPESSAPPWPKWVADLLPDLEALSPSGREAVRVLVKGLAKGS